MAVSSFSDKYTVTQVKPERYSDFYTNLDKNFGTKDLARLTDEDSVIRSLKNIVLTRKGERPFFPEFGCNITSLLFENFNEFSKKTLETEIKTAVENFEPRIKTIKVVINDQSDINSTTLDMFFTLINRTDTLSVSFLLSRIR